MKLENVIYSGDNLTWLKKFPDKYIDLIYLDPPFFSNRHYEVIFNDGEEIRSFEDRWKGGINHYIEWMREKDKQIAEINNRLKEANVINVGLQSKLAITDKKPNIFSRLFFKPKEKDI